MTDKKFVWHDNYNRGNDNKEDEFESYDNIRYETAIEELQKKHSRLLKITAVTFLIFVILLIVILYKSQKLAEINQVLIIEKRLDRLEAKFTTLKTYIASKLDQALKEMERDRHTTTTQKKPLAKTPPPPQEEQRDIETKVHKVQAGDTLYHISLQYGISIALLRDYNNLEPNATIHPGQQIKLDP